MSKKILISLRGNRTSDFLLQYFFKNINIKKNFEPVILLSEKGFNLKNDFIYFKNEKIKVKESFSYSFKFLFKNFFIVLKSLIIFSKNIFLLKKNGFEWFKFNFHVENIYIGDLFIDTYNRFHLNFQNRTINLYLIITLIRSIIKTLYIKKIILSEKIERIICHNSGYANNNTLSLRIGLKYKIKTIQPIFNDYILWNNYKIEYGYYSLKHDKNFPKQIKKISKQNINNFLNNRIKGKNSGHYTYYKDLIKNSSKKLNNNRSKIFKKLNISNFKKVVLIAPHAFSDATHVPSNKFIFLDYYAQLEETLNFITKNKLVDILFLVKPHPSSGRYNEIGIVEKIVKRLNQKNIVLCPNVPTKDVIMISDIVITGRGTIGIEAPCFGKNVITAGPSLYSGYDFIISPTSKKSYFNQILNLDKIQKLNLDQIWQAKKLLYFLEMQSEFSKDIRKYSDTYYLKKDLDKYEFFYINRKKKDKILFQKLKDDKFL